jgi:hypothetical protein
MACGGGGETKDVKDLKDPKDIKDDKDAERHGPPGFNVLGVLYVL